VKPQRSWYKFKETDLDIAISFSKFSELRPKWNVLPGAHGTHTTCITSQ
jgi:hypothetical protein